MRARSSVFLTLLVVSLAAPGAAQAATATVSAKPGLFPSFKPSVSDYVVRCTSEDPVRLVVRPGGGRAAVDGGRERRRRFRAAVDLDAGERTVVRHEQGKQVREYSVRCLPEDFPEWDYKRYRTPTEAYDIVTPSPYVAIFDRNGVPVWWHKASGPLPEDAKLFEGNTIGWFSATNPFIGPPSHEIRRFDGKVVKRLRARPTAPDFLQNPIDAHDIQPLPNGDHLVAVYKRRAGTHDLTSCGGPTNAVVYDAEIQRIRQGRKRAVWVWNSKDHVSFAESKRWCPGANIIGLPDGTKGYDVAHVNSMELRNNDDLLMSFRHTDSVYNVSYKTGKIKWKLGGTPTPQSLTVLDDTLTPTLGAQHFARFTGRNTITLHDNGTRLGRAPRALRLRIDQGARTARVLEQVTEKLAPTSFCCGSSQRFDNGSWLSSWGGTSVISEVGPRGGRRFVLRFKGEADIGGFVSPIFSYRVSPVMPGRIKRRDLREGMDAMHPRAVPADR